MYPHKNIMINWNICEVLRIRCYINTGFSGVLHEISLLSKAFNKCYRDFRLLLFSLRPFPWSKIIDGNLPNSDQSCAFGGQGPDEGRQRVEGTSLGRNRGGREETELQDSSGGLVCLQCYRQLSALLFLKPECFSRVGTSNNRRFQPLPITTRPPCCNIYPLPE